MDVVARSRRLLLITSALAGALACDRPPETPAGVSTASTARAQRGASPDGGATPSRELDLLPRDFRSRYQKLSPTRYLSSGHAAGRFDVEVYANAAAAEAYAKQSATFPVGAVFVKEHWERAGESPRPGPIMAMQKMARGFDAEHGDWRYVVVAPEGDVVVDGKPEGCVLCHDDAPQDRIFRAQPLR